MLLMLGGGGILLLLLLLFVSIFLTACVVSFDFALYVLEPEFVSFS